MIPNIISVMVSQGNFDTNLNKVVADQIMANIDRVPTTRHPLGFVHFDVTGLAKLPPFSFARLHVWDATLAPPDPAGNIHDHSWHLTSAILTGALRDRTFVPVPTPGGSLSAVRVEYGETNEFPDAGRYELRKLTDTTYRKGDVYQIKSRIVHESEPLGHPTVTLVVGLPDANAEMHGPLILSRSKQGAPGTPKRESLSPAAAKKVLEDIRSFI